VPKKYYIIFLILIGAFQLLMIIFYAAFTRNQTAYT